MVTGLELFQKTKYVDASLANVEKTSNKQTQRLRRDLTDFAFSFIFM